MTAVTYAQDGRAALITLNRPEVRNAISRRMLAELGGALDEALGDDGIDLILLRGAGADFCAGEDLRELTESPPDEFDAVRIIEGYQTITRQLMLGSKTVVCAARGWVIGGGAAWPLNADFTVWSEDARLKFPEGRHGLYASGGVTCLLERTCGSARARELLWLGETVTAGQLVRDRIATRLFPAAEFEAATRAMVDGLLALPRETLVRCKAAQASLIRGPLEAALQSEAAQMRDAARSVRENGARFTFHRT